MSLQGNTSQLTKLFNDVQRHDIVLYDGMISQYYSCVDHDVDFRHVVHCDMHYIIIYVLKY